jgi:hypothetical protein
MVAGGFAEVLFLVLIAGGGGNELLDYLPANAYWKAKGVPVTAERLLDELRAPAPPDVAALVRDLGAERHQTREEATRKLQALGAAAAPALRKAADSDDPEVRTRAGEILKALQGGGPQAQFVRRLMAIRTLGELRKPDALPALRPLLESKELFVADYARRAIAAIEGKPTAQPRVAKETLQTLQADLCLLPASCAIVAQCTAMPGGPVDFEKMIKETMAATVDLPAPPNLIEEVTKGIITAAEKVGNVRLDHATIGVAGDVGPQKGFIVVIARGLYDAEAAKAALKEQGVTSEDLDGITVFSPAKESKLIPCSNDRFVLAAGPGPDDIPTKELAAAIKANRNEPAFHAKLAEMIKGIELGSPMWMAVRMTDAYRQGPVLAPFESAVLTSQRNQEGALAARLVAQGKDAAAVKAAADEIEKGLQQAKAEFARDAGRRPFVKPMAEIIESIRLTNEGERLVLTGAMKEPSQAVAFVFVFLIRVRGGTGVGPPPRPAPGPVE